MIKIDNQGCINIRLVNLKGKTNNIKYMLPKKPQMQKICKLRYKFRSLNFYFLLFMCKMGTQIALHKLTQCNCRTTSMITFHGNI